MKQALISDFDMTLVDSRLDIAIACSQAMRHLSGKQYSPEEIMPVMPLGIQEVFNRFVPDVAIGDKRFWEGVKVYQTFYREHCADNSTIYPGVIETLTALREKGVKMAVASNKYAAIARHVATKMGLDHFFSYFHGTEETPGKPEPDVILKCLEALGVPADQALTVGDKPSDLKAGKAAGTAIVGVTYGLGEYEELMACGPDRLIDRFDQIMEFFG